MNRGLDAAAFVSSLVSVFVPPVALASIVMAVTYALRNSGRHGKQDYVTASLILSAASILVWVVLVIVIIHLAPVCQAQNGC